MVEFQAPGNSGWKLPPLFSAWRRKCLPQQVEFSIHGFPVQKQSQGLLKTRVSWKQMCFPFDFLVGGKFSPVLSGFLELVLVDRMFLPHILSSLPHGNALLTFPLSQLFKPKHQCSSACWGDPKVGWELEEALFCSLDISTSISLAWLFLLS